VEEPVADPKQQPKITFRKKLSIFCAVFVGTMVAEVLPNLSKVPTAAFDQLDSDALACLQRYLKHHAAQIVQLGLEERVVRFMAAHESRIDWAGSPLQGHV
jgi:hypothetical protein